MPFKCAENAATSFSRGASGACYVGPVSRGGTGGDDTAFMEIKKLAYRKGFLNRRAVPRRMINRVAKIQFGSGTLPRDCLITDISTRGVRLHVEGYEVPDQFVLLLSGEGLAKECNYQVVWRLGHEIGARFVGVIRRVGNAARS